MQNSKTTFCSSSRHTTEDGAVDKCNASFTAFICSPSFIQSTKKSQKHHYIRRQRERKESRLLPLGFHLGFTAAGSAWFSSVPKLFTCKRITSNRLNTGIERDERAYVGDLGFWELHCGRNWRLLQCICEAICEEARKDEIATSVLRRWRAFLLREWENSEGNLKVEEETVNLQWGNGEENRSISFL